MVLYMGDIKEGWFGEMDIFFGESCFVMLFIDIFFWKMWGEMINNIFFYGVSKIFRGKIICYG